MMRVTFSRRLVQGKQIFKAARRIIQDLIPITMDVKGIPSIPATRYMDTHHGRIMVPLMVLVSNLVA
ncbi:hypothetical protein TIFTF001_029155 [Ficus carica]|uniref:Uncharacterized protein n=1 Tax=Ficus carica TaxID=3494 RepID=A0AA88DR20_FICCA|nr:hypothetical protein TIFTF001_029155 [Ficus carica]